jgi:hypothetical protein
MEGEISAVVSASPLAGEPRTRRARGSVSDLPEARIGLEPGPPGDVEELAQVRRD